MALCLYGRLLGNEYMPDCEITDTYTPEKERQIVGEEREREMLLFIVHMNGHSSSSHDYTETYFDIDNGDGGLGLVEVACHPVHGFWYKIKHQI